MILMVNIIFFQIRRSSLNLAILIFLAIGVVTSAQALGLGELRVQSALGQALKAQLSLIGLDGNEFASTCVKAKVDTTEGTFLANVIVAVHKLDQSTSIHLSTRQGLNEPAVKITVDVECKTQLHREFLILLDPPRISPDYDKLGMASTLGASSLPSEAASKPVAPTSIVVKNTALTPRDKLVNFSSPRRIKPMKSVRQVKDVLKLSDESFVMPRGLKISDKLSTSLEQQLTENVEDLRSAQKHMAALLRDENPDQIVKSDQVARQNEIQALQSELVLLKKQNRADKATIEEIQKNSFSRNWMIGLAALILVGAVMISLLYLQIRRTQKETEMSWWEQGQEKKEAERRKNVKGIVNDVQASYQPGTTKLETSSLPTDEMPEQNFDEAGESANLDLAESPALNVNQILKQGTATIRRTPTLEETNSSTFNFFSNRGSSVKVEEISDVTQEAEFWMSVNDPQRAIEILDSQAKIAHPDSPVPWLYLLDLYRLVQDKQKYDELRERFIVFFNANIPEFEDRSSNNGVRQLESFPHLIELICQLWNGNEIIPFLQSLLIDDRDGKRIGFELSVYRDILLLISLAHELERISAIEGPVANGWSKSVDGLDHDEPATSSNSNPGIIEFEVIDFPKMPPQKE